jgi:hypothetical protein
MFDPDMQFPDWPGAHPGVLCQFWLMLISWMLGYPDRSLDELRAAVKSAETLGHPRKWSSESRVFGGPTAKWTHSPGGNTCIRKIGVITIA